MIRETIRGKEVITLYGKKLMSLTDAMAVIAPDATNASRWFSQREAFFEKGVHYMEADGRFPGRAGRVWIVLPSGMARLKDGVIAAQRLHVVDNLDEQLSPFLSVQPPAEDSTSKFTQWERMPTPALSVQPPEGVSTEDIAESWDPLETSSEPEEESTVVTVDVAEGWKSAHNHPLPSDETQTEPSETKEESTVSEVKEQNQASVEEATLRPEVPPSDGMVNFLPQQEESPDVESDIELEFEDSADVPPPTPIEYTEEPTAPATKQAAVNISSPDIRKVLTEKLQKKLTIPTMTFSNDLYKKMEYFDKMIRESPDDLRDEVSKMVMDYHRAMLETYLDKEIEVVLETLDEVLS